MDWQHFACTYRIVCRYKSCHTSQADGHAGGADHHQSSAAESVHGEGTNDATQNDAGLTPSVSTFSHLRFKTTNF